MRNSIHNAVKKVLEYREKEREILNTLEERRLAKEIITCKMKSLSLALTFARGQARSELASTLVIFHRRTFSAVRS